MVVCIFGYYFFNFWLFVKRFNYILKIVFCKCGDFFFFRYIGVFFVNMWYYYIIVCKNRMKMILFFNKIYRF